MAGGRIVVVGGAKNKADRSYVDAQLGAKADASALAGKAAATDLTALASTVADKADAAATTAALAGKASASALAATDAAVADKADAAATAASIASLTEDAERATVAELRARATNGPLTPEIIYPIADAVSAGLIVPAAPHRLDPEGLYGGGKAIYVRRVWVGTRNGINVPPSFTIGADSTEMPGWAKFPADFSTAGNANLVYLDLSKVNAGGAQLASALVARTQASTFDKGLLADFHPVITVWGRQVDSAYAFEWVTASPETRLVLASPLVMQRDRDGTPKLLVSAGFAHHPDIGEGAGGFAAFSNPTGEAFKSFAVSTDPAGANRVCYSHKARRAGGYPLVGGSAITPGADFVELATTIGSSVRSAAGVPVVGEGGTVQPTPNQCRFTKRPGKGGPGWFAYGNTAEKAISSTYFGAATAWGFGAADGAAFVGDLFPEGLPRRAYWFARFAAWSDQDETTWSGLTPSLFAYDVEGNISDPVGALKLEAIRGAREASFVGWGILPAGALPWATWALGAFGPSGRDIRFTLPQVAFSRDPIAWIDREDLTVGAGA